MKHGRRHPFEIFIASANMEHYAWTVALTRTISAIFRRGGDVSFVAEELQQIFDPRGGAWIDRRYVPSVVASIGGVIKEHLDAIEAETTASPPRPSADAPGQESSAEPPARSVGAAAVAASDPNTLPATDPPTQPTLGSFCPRCAQPTLVRREGCEDCSSCGYSKC